jgi:hypothetical protein
LVGHQVHLLLLLLILWLRVVVAVELFMAQVAVEQVVI